MMKTLLTTAALAGLLATAAFPQEAPATDEAAPLTETAPGAATTLDAAPEASGDAAMDTTVAREGWDEVDEGWERLDPATVSADTLIGADIVNLADEKVATIQDVLLTPEGQVENVVATFGGFLGFGADTVLLPLDEIDVVKSVDNADALVVRTNVTPESLEGRPAYEG